MGFPSKVKEDALVASARHCCLCHRFCGTKMEVHHIKPEPEGGDSGFDNAIPLCFDCHADMRSSDHKHPKGNKYSESELRRHRDNWYDKVKGNIGIANKTEAVETDKSIYQILVRMLPWNDSILFLAEHDFGDAYELERVRPLWHFIEQCKEPAFEFLDPDLEGLRLELAERARSFSHELGRLTFRTHRPGWQRVPDEWSIEQPDRRRSVVRSLNTLSDEVVEAYQSLVRTATRKLGVLPEEMSRNWLP